MAVRTHTHTHTQAPWCGSQNTHTHTHTGTMVWQSEHTHTHTHTQAPWCGSQNTHTHTHTHRHPNTCAHVVSVLLLPSLSLSLSLSLSVSLLWDGGRFWVFACLLSCCQCVVGWAGSLRRISLPSCTLSSSREAKARPETSQTSGLLLLRFAGSSSFTFTVHLASRVIAGRR